MYSYLYTFQGYSTTDGGVYRARMPHRQIAPFGCTLCRLQQWVMMPFFQPQEGHSGEAWSRPESAENREMGSRNVSAAKYPDYQAGLGPP